MRADGLWTTPYCPALLVLLCSKSDPMAVLFEDKDGRWVEAGRTEMIANNLSELGCEPECRGWEGGHCVLCSTLP